MEKMYVIKKKNKNHNIINKIKKKIRIPKSNISYNKSLFVKSLIMKLKLNKYVLIYIGLYSVTLNHFTFD